MVEKVESVEWGLDGDHAKRPLFSNLYPPLTPVPQCVAEIRAIGQSPIHYHPEYFKVKPSRLTKSLTHQRFTSPLFLPCALSPKDLLQFFVHSSLYGPVFCLHTKARGRERSWKFWKFPKFPYFSLMRFWFGVQ